MIKKVFIDSDILIDTATARKPFFENSRMIISMAENNKILGVISSNCVTNIYYILRKISTGEKAKEFIRIITRFITVIPVSHENILHAVDSGFSDFEDAVQYFSALNYNCDYIVTRNITDYKNSTISVVTPKELISLFREK
jgi:predicted nucleic acid-binding protein